ncbi:CPBP family intramembrane glutamic endopeptidase [Pseudoduganella chitinolytica]|uniref:CPBP family intramembrane metalloprotease n=1 Tax=Pseudoduganella chitinolytica TaxID=34070 RepID=A0ABY8B7A1_9BURK|nr:CPBP family intramembrane glutamic endopeptidase [Pseudoduganella chitinolytica]WEF31815.1 CPBP family intramembrane metalloprotease [Pseudoduganella chitinolytica]
MGDLAGPVAAVYWLLALAVVSLWSPPLGGRVPAWPACLAVAIAAAWVGGFIALPGVAALLVLAALCQVYQRSASTVARALLVGAIVVLALALALHKVPGFANPLLLQGVQVSPGAAAVTQYLNVDKAAVGILLCAFFCAPARRGAEWRAVPRALPIVLLTPVVVLAGALLSGTVAVDPKLPPFTPLFLVTNLLFTCVAEEAFFRGVVQGGLLRALEGKRHGPAVAIGVASVLFGIAHAGGGIAMIVLATLAGIGYGLAAWRSGRIEAAILAHFVVNALRFLLVTYPLLVRA